MLTRSAHRRLGLCHSEHTQASQHCSLPKSLPWAPIPDLGHLIQGAGATWKSELGNVKSAISEKLDQSHLFGILETNVKSYMKHFKNRKHKNPTYMMWNFLSVHIVRSKWLSMSATLPIIHHMSYQVCATARGGNSISYMSNQWQASSREELVKLPRLGDKGRS